MLTLRAYPFALPKNWHQGIFLLFLTGLMISPWVSLVHITCRFMTLVLCLPVILLQTEKAIQYLLFGMLLLLAGILGIGKTAHPLYKIYGGTALFFPLFAVVYDLVKNSAIERLASLKSILPMGVFFALHSLLSADFLSELRFGLFIPLTTILIGYVFYLKPSFLPSFSTYADLSFKWVLCVSLFFCCWGKAPFRLKSASHKFHVVMLLLFSLPFVIKWIREKNLWSFFLCSVALICLLRFSEAKTELMALVLTYSIALLAFRYGKALCLLFMGFFVAYGLCMMFFFRTVINSALFSSLSEYFPSFYERTLLWHRAQNLIDIAPWWGRGLRHAQVMIQPLFYYLQGKPFPNSIELQGFVPLHPHNIFLEILMAFGRCGLCVFLGTVLWWLYVLYKKPFSVMERAFFLSFLCCLSIVTLTTYCLLSQPWTLSWVGIMLWSAYFIVPMQDQPNSSRNMSSSSKSTPSPSSSRDS